MHIRLRWPSSKSVRLASCRLGFNSKPGQTNDFKMGIYSLPASRAVDLGLIPSRVKLMTLKWVFTVYLLREL